jgi:hypothetical protein
MASRANSSVGGYCTKTASRCTVYELCSVPPMMSLAFVTPSFVPWTIWTNLAVLSATSYLNTLGNIELVSAEVRAEMSN